MLATTPTTLDDIIVVPLYFHAFPNGILARKQHARRALIQNGCEWGSSAILSIEGTASESWGCAWLRNSPAR